MVPQLHHLALRDAKDIHARKPGVFTRRRHSAPLSGMGAFRRPPRDDQISFRYVPRLSRSSDAFDGTNLGTFPSKGTGKTLLTGLGYTHLFGPVLINETRFGFTRTWTCPGTRRSSSRSSTGSE